MLSFLFPRLTPAPLKGTALFNAVTTKARQRHWYVDGQVPDTIDGRFRVLATVAALVLVRLERDGEAGDALSVAVTERFIEVMESEHRELGLGDPKLGRTVRKLVAALARRVELWRNATAGEAAWSDAARQSLYRHPTATDALTHSAASLRAFWAELEGVGAGALAEGQIA